MLLSEKKKLAIKYIKEITLNGIMNIDDKGMVLSLEELILAYRETIRLQREHGDIDISGLTEFSNPSITSSLKLLF